MTHAAHARPDRPLTDGTELLAEPLRSRWSPSFFDERETLSRAEVTALLQAARWAPSSGNSQPWVFLVAERGSVARAVVDDALTRGNAWVRRAPLVLVAVARIGSDPDAEPDGKPPRDPASVAFDVGQAAAHVTLQAAATGRHAHQIAGFDKDAVAAGLGVPGHYRVMSGIVIGSRGDPAAMPDSERDREARPRTRRPLPDVALTRWGVPW